MRLGVIQDFWRGKGCIRRCLSNVFEGPSQVKGSHLPEGLSAESSPKACGQVFSQTFNDLFAILRPLLPSLLGIDDAPANFPMAGGHQGVDIASGGTAGNWTMEE